MVIPAILVHSEEEFKAKIEKIRHLGAMVQIDVMDGEFVDNTTWAEAEKIPVILDDLPFEVHLMVQHPGEHIKKWLDVGATRVYFHIEAVHNPLAIIHSLDGDVDRIGIAINPDTDTRIFDDILQEIQQVLVMGVMPGWGGQDFQEPALLHLRELRERYPDISLSVDGGVTLENIEDIRDAGADDVVSGSTLVDAEEPDEIFDALS